MTVSFSIMSSRFTHVVACVGIASLFGDEYSLVHTYRILLSVPSIDGHLECFYLLATVNNAAINTGVPISVQVPAFRPFVYICRRRISE